MFCKRGNGGDGAGNPQILPPTLRLGEGIWCLPWVGLLGKKDLARKVAHCLTLKRAGNPSKMGIRFGFNEAALLFGAGCLGMCPLVLLQGGEETLMTLMFHGELYS